MGNETNDIELSAYADGELDAAQAATVDARVQSNPDLRRTLASYKTLDDAAAHLPVPTMSENAFSKTWHAIAEMTTQVTAADRRAFARLEQAAAALPVPAMSELAAEKAWRTVAERTTALSAADRRAFARLDAAAAALPVPQLSDETLVRAEENVRLRTTQSGVRSAVRKAGVPEVSTQQWDKVWQGIRERTRHTAAEPRRATGSLRLLLAARARSSWQRWFVAASLAAAVVFAVLVFALREPDETIAMVDVPPEALDERYQVQVKYVEGESTPVICFFLKDDASADKTAEKWRWLPE